MLLFQDPAATLTLTRVATAPALVAEVAKAIGKHLEVSPSLGRDVLMVSVEGAKVSEVLARIAIADSATWLPIEGGYRLVPDNGARGIEAVTERARRLQSINEAMKKKAAEALAKSQRAADAGANFAGAFMGNSSVDAFVPMLDLNAIAAMDSGDRIVFASAPTAAQRPLRGNPNALVSDWIATHNKAAKSMAASMGEVPEGMDALMKGPIGERMRKMSQPITVNPSKVVVVATRGATPFFGGNRLDVRLEVRAYAPDGSVLVEETGTLDADMMALFAALGTPKKATTPSTATPVEYSPEAKALAGLSNVESLTMGAGAFGGSPRATPLLRKFLFSPERHEPLSLVPGEGLAALAKARHKPLVACIPDSAYPAMLGNPAPKTVEDVEEGLKTGSMRLVPDATFLVVKPAEPATCRRTRLDRNALGTLLRQTEDHETPTLDELADFASKTPSPSQNALSMSLLSVFVPSSIGGMSGLVSWDALRLYADLSTSQRQSLASGANVPFNTISPAGQSALAAMLYGAGGGLTLGDGRSTPEVDLISVGIKMAMGGGSTTAREEPTEVAPQGLPAGGYLQATLNTDTIIRPLGTDGPASSTLGTEELAMIRLFSTGPMASQVGDAMKLPETGRLGSRTTWSLRGFVAPGAFVAGTLTDDRTPKDGQQVSLTNLPDALQAKVAQRTEKLKNSPFGAILAMGAMGAPKQKP